MTPRLLGNAALRFEHFEDFGNVAIWKLAGRFRVTENLNLRASLGTGFRAPTPGQMSTTNVSTRIGGDGTPRAEGLFPATHPAAALFGALPLEAETSRSVTAGIALDLPFAWPATVTVDCYRIDLDDRITLSSQFPVGPAEAAELVALGVPGANDIAQVRFFVNDVRTRTQGVDVVANWQLGGAPRRCIRRGGGELQSYAHAGPWPLPVRRIPNTTSNTACRRCAEPSPLAMPGGRSMAWCACAGSASTATRRPRGSNASSTSGAKPCWTPRPGGRGARRFAFKSAPRTCSTPTRTKPPTRPAAAWCIGAIRSCPGKGAWCTRSSKPGAESPDQSSPTATASRSLACRKSSMNS